MEDLYESDNPIEFIVIIGDTDGSFGVQASNNYGDHEYTTLDGGDILADCFIGRMSATTQTDLVTIWNKVQQYEIEPNMNSTDWYEESVLVGDSSPSGVSCYFTNMYVKEQILLANPNHDFDEYYSGNPSVNSINNSITSGKLFIIIGVMLE